MRIRPRRLRRTSQIRDMVRETSISVKDLIAPLFVRYGKGIKEPIPSMSGQFRFSVDKIADEVKEIWSLGIPAIILFGIPDKKDPIGSSAWADDGIVQQAIKEIKSVDPDLEIVIEKINNETEVFTLDSQRTLSNLIYAIPNGVMRMSNEMEGLTETSTNMAIVKSEKGTTLIACLLRSSVDSAKIELTEMMTSAAELAGAKAVFEGEYPGWKPNPDSAILATMIKGYETQFGKTPEIKAIHAGLECGLLGGIYPNWDMISFGPTIRFPHSPDEKVNIKTVGKFWDFLKETLKNAPKK